MKRSVGLILLLVFFTFSLLAEVLSFPDNTSGYTLKNNIGLEPRIDYRYNLSKCLLNSDQLEELTGSKITNIRMYTAFYGEVFDSIEVNVKLYIKVLDSDYSELTTSSDFNPTADDIYLDHDYSFNSIDDYVPFWDFQLDRPFEYIDNQDLVLCYITEYIGDSSICKNINLTRMDQYYYKTNTEFTTSLCYCSDSSCYNIDSLKTQRYVKDYLPKMDFTYSQLSLPVEMSSYNANVIENNQVKIEWHTESETNTSGYYIYHNDRDELSSAEKIPCFIHAKNSEQGNDYLFVDNEVSGCLTRFYWIESSDLTGESEFFGPMYVEINNANDNSPSYQYDDGIKSIYPNPFNNSTRIALQNKSASKSTLSIYNIKGQLVRSFQDIDFKKDGSCSCLWNGHDSQGKKVSSGVYWAKASINGKSYQKKILLLK